MFLFKVLVCTELCVVMYICVEFFLLFLFSGCRLDGLEKAIF